MNNPGDRIKALRGYLAISRKDFCQKHGFPEVTLKSWELSLKAISEKQLQKLIRAFELEKMFCSKEWILEGSGPSPFSEREHIQEKITQRAENFLLDSQERHLQQVSLKFFQEIYPKGIHVLTNDDWMSPFFIEGDIVCGIPTSTFLKGQLYILEMTDKRKFVRLLFPSKKEGCVSFATPQNRINFQFQSDVPYKQIYQIVLICKANATISFAQHKENF